MLLTKYVPALWNGTAVPHKECNIGLTLGFKLLPSHRKKRHVMVMLAQSYLPSPHAGPIRSLCVQRLACVAVFYSPVPHISSAWTSDVMYYTSAWTSFETCFPSDWPASETYSLSVWAGSVTDSPSSFILQRLHLLGFRTKEKGHVVILTPTTSPSKRQTKIWDHYIRKEGFQAVGLQILPEITARAQQKTLPLTSALHSDDPTTNSALNRAIHSSMWFRIKIKLQCFVTFKCLSYPPLLSTYPSLPRRTSNRI